MPRITSASSNNFPSLYACKVFISSLIFFTSLKSKFRCSLSALPKLRLYFRAILLNSSALFLSSFTSFCCLLLASLPSVVWAKIASSTFVVLPTLSIFNCCFINPLAILSTAVLLGAATTIFCPCNFSCTIASINVVVLPVPGGPCTMHTSLFCSIAFTAFFWLSFS